MKQLMLQGGICTNHAPRVKIYIYCEILTFTIKCICLPLSCLLKMCQTEFNGKIRKEPKQLGKEIIFTSKIYSILVTLKSRRTGGISRNEKHSVSELRLYNQIHIRIHFPFGPIVPPSLPPCSEWKGVPSAMNVNQSEEESEPSAAVLLWPTQADQHLTEKFLIALWSCSINSLALAIICPCFLSFERGNYCVPHSQAKAIISTPLSNLWGVNMSDILSTLY